MDIDKTVKPLSLHQDASDYSLQLNRWFLKPVGAWPNSATTTTGEKIFSVILIIVCFSLISCTVVPCILNILLEETDMKLKLMAIGPLSHWGLSGINYISLLFHNSDIRRCLQHMKNDWLIVTEIEDRQTMLKYARFGRFVAALCAIFMHSGVISHAVLQSISPKITYIGNESVIIHIPPCPTYSKFLDIRYSPDGEIVLMLQLFSAIVVNSVTVGACSLAAVFAMHACGQLNVLMRWLNQLVDGGKRIDTEQRRLAIIVEHHLRVLSFITQMEALLNQICFVELLECTFNLCMLGYYFITGWNVIEKRTSISYVIIYISMSINIFIFCYIGEILTEQCKQVGEKAYMIEWYRLPCKTALGLVLIISRSSTITKLTAGKLIHLSIPTFGNVMRTSMIYLNMLRTMTA